MLCQGRFRLNIKKNFLTEGVITHCNKLPRAEPLSLKVCKNTMDMTVSAHGLVDMMMCGPKLISVISEVFSSIINSVVL